jgi:hypothetical protein
MYCRSDQYTLKVEGSDQYTLKVEGRDHAWPNPWCPTVTHNANEKQFLSITRKSCPHLSMYLHSLCNQYSFQAARCVENVMPQCKTHLNFLNIRTSQFKVMDHIKFPPCDVFLNSISGEQRGM